MIQPERVSKLNNAHSMKGAYVLYWMQASQRASGNHALEYAVRLANERREPLLVCFGIWGGYPEAAARHYRFMLEGLQETAARLNDRGIGFVVRLASPEQAVLEFAGEASVIVCDAGCLRFQREWRRTVAQQTGCPVYQVESDVIVPVATASPKEEYSAATLRRKITPQLSRYLVPLEEQDVLIDSLKIAPPGLCLDDIDAVMSQLNVDGSVAPAPGIRGGTIEAEKMLDDFISLKLDSYHERRNDPTMDAQSGLSPYLHFGQISPLQAALAAGAAGGPGAEAFLDELIVRRELAVNFVFYNTHYDSFESLPDWAKSSLLERAADHREYLYTLEQLETAATHDPYWNAAQRQMVNTGRMHGYMRMYWGKKILEWTDEPEEAYRRALYLNNRYELDGRDANGYAGVAWCFGKHDRPWGRRPVFGPVRYMNANGLRRKFDADRYAAMW